MAILTSVPGIEATIQVNNQPLVEHEDDDPAETLGEDALLLGAKTTSKYIESITGQEFSVHCSVAKPYQRTSASVAVHIYVDGIYISGRVLGTPPTMHPPPPVAIVKGPSTFTPGVDRETIHHFTFSNIKTSKHFRSILRAIANFF